ncbi:YchJ family protein [Povalibacter sp.]|nr:YchJ family metal-binding protein [Povalibacter sp.]
MPCPCGSTLALAACCGRWHAGASAPTAEQLMRSRYAAFVLLDAPYLLRTWHVSTRPASVSFEPGLKWLGLKVVSARTVDADRAEVEFIARYRVGGASAGRHHERSRFVCEGGEWFYVDGSACGAGFSRPSEKSG